MSDAPVGGASEPRRPRRARPRHAVLLKLAHGIRQFDRGGAAQCFQGRIQPQL